MLPVFIYHEGVVVWRVQVRRRYHRGANFCGFSKRRDCFWSYKVMAFWVFLNSFGWVLISPTNRFSLVQSLLSLWAFYHHTILRICSKVDQDFVICEFRSIWVRWILLDELSSSVLEVLRLLLLFVPVIRANHVLLILVER